MEERAELIIDTEEIDDENILFLKPNYIKGARFCASNIFDYVSIKHCPTEKLNSGSLVGIFNSLKPGAQISIVVNQPISVMLEYDSKQIEANLKLVGFEDITYEERNSTDKKKGMGLIEGVLTAIKPINKEKDIQIEIVKREYNYKNKNENKKEKENDKDDWASYRIPKKVEKVERIEKVEEVKEEPLSNRYKKGRFNNSSNNIEKNGKQEVIPPKKYNRFSKNVEEQKPKEDVIQQEVVIKEEKRVRPKRFGFGRTEVKEEKPQVYIKTEITETKGGNKPGDISTTKEIVIEKTTVIDKNTELENKKAGLRKRYGKH